MFLLMGGRNPEGSEPCSPILYCVLGDPNNLLNDNVGDGSRVPSMEETCGRLLHNQRMMGMMNPIMFKYY